MAKKKQEPKASPTDEQVALLSRGLIWTRTNIYSKALGMFNVAIDEDVFDRLRKHDLFRCENCDTWKHLAEEATADLCTECGGEEKGDDL